jgi:IclR family transcriptional regulator, KDG regulon repressor
VTSVESRPPKGRPVKSADRTLDIFELLASEPSGLTSSEISQRLGLAQSSAHGLVRTLRARGYLTEDASRRLHLGAGLIQLGLNVADQLEVRTAARVPLERLVAATGDTALLVVVDRGNLLYVDKVLSDARDVRTDPRVSSKRPLQCSSLGKALLAALANDAVEGIIDRIGLEPATDYSLTDRQALIDDLAETRRRGYSVDKQEALLGVYCVGAPVRDHIGRPFAAISLSTIEQFFESESTGPQVTAAAVEISQAIGWRGEATTLYEPVPGSESLFLVDDVHEEGRPR